MREPIAEFYSGRDEWDTVLKWILEAYASLGLLFLKYTPDIHLERVDQGLV